MAFLTYEIKLVPQDHFIKRKNRAMSQTRQVYKISILCNRSNIWQFDWIPTRDEAKF